MKKTTTLYYIKSDYLSLKTCFTFESHSHCEVLHCLVDQNNEDSTLLEAQNITYIVEGQEFNVLTIPDSALSHKTEDELYRIAEANNNPIIQISQKTYFEITQNKSQMCISNDDSFLTDNLSEFKKYNTRGTMILMHKGNENSITPESSLLEGKWFFCNALVHDMVSGITRSNMDGKEVYKLDTIKSPIYVIPYVDSSEFEEFEDSISSIDGIIKIVSSKKRLRNHELLEAITVDTPCVLAAILANEFSTQDLADTPFCNLENKEEVLKRTYRLTHEIYNRFTDPENDDMCLIWVRKGLLTLQYIFSSVFITPKVIMNRYGKFSELINRVRNYLSIVHDPVIDKYII